MLLIFCITNGFTHHAYSQCLEDQRTLLLELKNDLIFDSTLSTKLVLWNQTQDCCSWDGVECDGTGHVISLQLNEEGISSGIHNLSTLSGLRYLQKLNLAYNDFGGVPIEVSLMRRLVSLDLSSFSYAALKIENPNLKILLQNLTGLRELYLDGVNISAQGSEWCQAISSSLPELRILSLRVCSLSGPLHPSLSKLHFLSVVQLDGNDILSPVPNFFANFSYLTTLTLVGCGLNNSLSGSILQSLFSLPSLKTLILSDNQLSGRLYEFPTLQFSNIVVLDLSDNRLEGQIPESFFTLERLEFLILSQNFFNGTVQLEKFQRLQYLRSLDLSYNNLFVDTSITNTSLSTFPQLFCLSGAIPTSFCNATQLEVLDLSANKLSGTIPPCLVQNLKKLGVLNFWGNNISGNIPNTFCVNCSLEILDIRQNYLEGSLPVSLANCKSLQVLNVGNNNIDDGFPCMLASSLRVLVLRSNRFHGQVRCSRSWSNLQIIDIASNNFTGYLYTKSFSGMMLEKDARLESDYIHYNGSFVFGDQYYAAKVIIKGVELEVEKILTTFTVIDFSCNNFQGEIPDAIGDLSSLQVLNLSHNTFTGTIPKSLGNLTQLGSLDLSANQLRGEIPKELTRLTFLGALNLSNNQLIGPIPSGPQLQTFSTDSFQGNTGLCGFPLNISCRHTGENDNVPSPNSYRKDEAINWDYVSVAVGYVVGLGSILWLFLLSKLQTQVQ
ncbi:UNVERIFIED_CONTAM: Receptor-like protein 35 [Sesamum calycinum]|uniref:Receptor-like protein 35 n=1 Tax=Sesamum calycinum TaxID=2727403 RepID=A0AAW2S9R8_9LAMI